MYGRVLRRGWVAHMEDTPKRHDCRDRRAYRTPVSTNHGKKPAQDAIRHKRASASSNALKSRPPQPPSHEPLEILRNHCPPSGAELCATFAERPWGHGSKKLWCSMLRCCSRHRGPSPAATNHAPLHCELPRRRLDLTRTRGQNHLFRTRCAADPIPLFSSRLLRCCRCRLPSAVCLPLRCCG